MKSQRPGRPGGQVDKQGPGDFVEFVDFVRIDRKLPCGVAKC